MPTTAVRLPAEPKDHTPTVGDYVVPDGWNNIGGKLFECDDWDAADLRLETNTRRVDGNGYIRLAVEVEITSRTWRTRNTDYGWSRVKITFIKDGKPNTTTRGWLKPMSTRLEYADGSGKSML